MFYNIRKGNIYKKLENQLTKIKKFDILKWP